MIGWLNLGSLLFGLVAWVLPVVNFMRYTKHDSNNWVILSMMSISACAIALFFQIFSFYERVKAEDWSALMDTVSIIVSIPAVLIIGTIILNAITLIVYRGARTRY